MSNVITILTDFGTSDSYVAQMKGVMLSRSRLGVTIVDISHDVPPQDIVWGAQLLRESALQFPPRTVHIAVVDPGVGTSRPIVVAEIAEHFFIAPDNGLLSRVLDEFPAERILALENSHLWVPHVSSTFHGRDIMAPVAVFLAEGGDIAEVGPAAGCLTRLPVVKVAVGNTPGQFELNDIRIDHFGNILTQADPQALRGLMGVKCLSLEFGERTVAATFVSTYGAMAPGSLVALWGSQGKLEIAVVNGNAARVLDLRNGDSLKFRCE